MGGLLLSTLAVCFRGRLLSSAQASALCAMSRVYENAWKPEARAYFLHKRCSSVQPGRVLWTLSRPVQSVLIVFVWLLLLLLLLLFLWLLLLLLLFLCCRPHLTASRNKGKFRPAGRLVGTACFGIFWRPWNRSASMQKQSGRQHRDGNICTLREHCGAQFPRTRGNSGKV